MIKIETATELKSAGLEWEPQNGDLYYADRVPCIFYRPYTTPCGAMDNTWVYAPSLSQLLTEIERRGYEYELKKFINGPKRFDLFKNGYWVMVFTADSPEEACAQALLWILKEGK